jgi:hypothetical protein
MCVVRNLIVDGLAVHVIDALLYLPKLSTLFQLADFLLIIGADLLLLGDGNSVSNILVHIRFIGNNHSAVDHSGCSGYICNNPYSGFVVQSCGVGVS